MQQHLPFTVLKLTEEYGKEHGNAPLQQHLPFTVLKLMIKPPMNNNNTEGLQQHLPFTVLKRSHKTTTVGIPFGVATAPTVYGMRRRVRGSRGAKRR